jgi:hypothetical protein
MANLINADPTNGLKLISDSSSEIQLQANGTTIATINSSGLSMNSGTLAGNGPAFSAWQSTQQTGITSDSFQKVLYQTELWDTNSNYDVSNSRFTPTVAGYYLFNAAMQITTVSTSGRVQLILYKNGAAEKDGGNGHGDGSIYSGSDLGCVAYANGSTDYFEIYVYGTSGGATFDSVAAQRRTWFDATLIRAA